ncbi:hypothetical protein ACQJBY_036758 [Aegilops geniculata]
MDIMQTSDSSQYGVVENSPYRFPYNKRVEDGNLGASWYFSRKEIEENSLSRRDGISLKKESFLRKSYCTFLQDLGVRLQVPPVTIATAIVFCHRFFLRQSHAKNDRLTVATVCMFLAGKVEETPIPLKDVILISYEIIHKKDPGAVARIKQKEVYEQQKKLLLIGERAVLVTLDFDFNVHHPYKPLVEAIKKLKIAQKELAQVAWSFVNDGLCTSLCLQFKPQHIAAGAIFLAAKFLKVKLPADGEKVWWQDFDVTPWQLEEVSNQMMELYGPPPSQGNNTKSSSASLADQHAVEKAPGAAEEPPAHKNHPASRQSSLPDHHHPEWQNSNQRIAQAEARDGTAISNEGPSMPPSGMDAVEKIDDLAERELEHGVELVAEDDEKHNRRQSGPRPPHREDHQKAAHTTEDTEEGGLSKDSQEWHSLEPDNPKRKEHRSHDRSERDLKRLRS